MKRGQSHAARDREESLGAYGKYDLDQRDSYKDICQKNKDAKEGEKYYSVRSK